MSAHAPIAPSSAARIVACPGSRKMESLYPQEDTIDTREGDAAHWGGSELLKGDQIAVGQVAPNGVVLNVEMVEAAEAYAGHIHQRECPGFVQGSCAGWIEKVIAKTPIHPDNFGTPDYRLYRPEIHHLFIDDFKYGRGFVSEIQNWQLVNYTALAADELGLFEDDTLKVTMTIHQPRCYHWRGPVRSWTTTLGALRPMFHEMKYAFALSMQDDAPVIARDLDSCRNCSARHECPALAMVTGPAMDLGYQSTPLDMSPRALSQELRRLRSAEKAIKARREGIEQSIMSKLQRGAVVPYFGMQHTKGRTIWIEGAQQQGIVEVAAAYNVKIEKPALITPLQAIKAGIPEDVVKLYSHATGGAAELVEDDGTIAASVFNKE